MHRFLAAAAASAVVLSAVPAFADSVTSTVVANDRVANRLVLSDNSVYSYDPEVVEIPESLTAGDQVEIDFESSEEEGIEKINSITILTEEDDG